MTKKMTKSTLIFALLLLSAVAVVALRTEPSAKAATNDTITLTSPNNVTIAETDDYATQVLGDPWDMNNLDDVNSPHAFTQPHISNGIWSATTTASTGGSIMLQYQNYANGYSDMTEKDGRNYPVDSSRFSRLWVRMNVTTGGQTLLWYFKHLTYAAAGNSKFFDVTPGWHIYTVDLRQTGGGANGNWAANGPYEGLRLDAPWNANNNNVQIDWARLTPDTGQAVRITWSYSGSGSNNVNLYLSTSPDPNSANEYPIATVAASAGAYTWTHTGVAPGTYYIHASMNGAVSSSGPLHVNTAPLVRIDAPSTLSGEDFAQHVLNTSWSGNNCNQFQHTANVADITCGSGVYQGVPTTSDPQLIWLNGDTTHTIDASRYFYMNIKFMVFPPAVRPWSPFNAGTRMTWNNGSGWSQTYMIVAPYNVWIPSAWDMRSVPRVEGNAWSGAVHTLRFDPLEDDQDYNQPSALPAGFQIAESHLTSQPYSNAGSIIRWTPLQGTGTVDLYWDHDRAGYNGTPIVTGVPTSQGSYSWDTSNLANGDYYVYVVAHDGYNSTRFYSLVPLAVDHSSTGTLFNDVPTNYWAVDNINALALKGIVSGVQQADSTVMFNPASSAYRAHLSKMVVLAAGWTLQNPASPTFHDVPAGSTFYGYIETAVAHGVISGYQCGGSGEPCDSQNRRYFRPNRNVTRGQTTKMIAISRGWTLDTPGTATFADVTTTDNLFPYVETAYAHGIISGYPCGGPGEPCNGNQQPYFRPGNSVTRAQLSKMLSTALGVTGPRK